MNLNMQSVSRTAAVIELPSAPPKKQQKRRFGRHDLACVLLILIGLVFFTTTDAARPPPKNQPPTVSITSPSAGSVVKGIVSFAANATDKVGVVRVNLLVNGAQVASTTVASTVSASYAFSWDSTKYQNGTVTLSAIAYDGAGKSATASETVTVSNVSTDTQAPSVAIGLPAPGSTVKGGVSVSVNATDNVGVTRVSLTANGVLVGNLTAAPYTFPWDSTKVADGGVTLLATAYDAAGKSASAASNVMVQNVVVTGGATYYVSSSSGSDANAGTQAAPWRTLAKVSSSSSLFKPGDSILLKRGDTWNEQLYITNQAGASGTPITYGAYGSGALPTVDAQQVRTFGVYMNNVSHIVVGDMRTINATANGFHIVAGSGNVSDVVVQRVLSERNARSGFYVEATPGVTDVDAIEYRDDEAHLNGGAGFLAYHVSEGATGVHYYACKASYNGQTTANHGFSTYVANNIHYHGVEAAFTNIDPATGLRNAFATGGEGIGIALDDYVSNSSVEHSYSHHNAGTGIMLTHESSNNVASYNVIANNGSIGLVVNGYSAGSSNITVLNNTIYGNKSYGMVAWKPVNGLTIKNNILVNNIGYGIGFSSTGITNYTVANNLAFGNTQGATAYVSGATGTFVADPLFAAPASGDFSLQASSPAINAGLYLGAPYQLGLMKGTIWPSAVLLLDQGAAWDIGAFVYAP